MSTWIVKVKAAAHLEPIVMGNIEETPGEGRAQIKEKARALVRKHFDENAKIVGLARGRVVVEVQGAFCSQVAPVLAALHRLAELEAAQRALQQAQCRTSCSAGRKDEK